MAQITTRIALKSDTQANWIASTLKALKGEYLFDSDSKYIKVGVGDKAWKDLDTIHIPLSAVDGYVPTVDTNTVYKIVQNSSDPKKWELFGKELSSETWNLSGTIDLNAIYTTLTGMIAEETSTREAEDAKLRGDIDAEVIRATGKEAELLTAITDEVTRAEGAEDALGKKIDGEIDRAKENEKALSGLVSAEVTRATKAEEALAGRLTTAEGAITTLNGEDTVEGSVKKSIKDAIEALDVDEMNGGVAKTITSISETDGKIAVTFGDITINANHVTGLVDALSSKADVSSVNAIDNRLITAESDVNTLKEGVSDLSTRMYNVEVDINALDTNKADLTALTAEVTRATEAEKALAGRLDTIQGEGEGSIKKALADAKEYADKQDAAVSAKTLADAKDYSDELSSALSTVIKKDYLKYSDVKTPITEQNKVATLADIAGLSGCVHLRGAFANQSSTSGKSDKQAFFDTYKPIEKGDIAINTSNGKEYLATENLPLSATADEINAGIVELGDEGLYETKADAELKLQKAKEYTDNAIKDLDVDTVTVGAGKTLVSISEVDGKISTEAVDIQITKNQVTDLTADLNGLSGAIEAEKTRATTAEKALSTDYNTKIEAEQNRATGVEDELRGKIDTALNDAKGYTDGKIADEVTARNRAISAAVETLDKADTAVAHQFVTAVSEEDGIITVSRAALTSADIPALEYDALGAAAQALSDAKTYTNGVSAELTADYVDKIATAKNEAISTVVGTDNDASEADTVKGAKKYTDKKVAEVQSNSLSGVTLNGEKFSVANNVATLTIDVISCGGAS